MPTHPQIKALYPDALEMQHGTQTLAVLPHAETETFFLRKLGYDVPAPILSHYDWAGAPATGPGSPFEVQRKTCAMLSMTQRGYVLNGLGTGKTKSALWAWDYLYGVGRCKKLLVVAPLSTLKFTWQREAFATLPHRVAVVLHGSKKKRLAELARPDADIFIINHDGVKLLEKDLVDPKWDINVVCIDELAVYRNGSSDRSKCMRRVAEKFDWVWGMTGGPIPTSPTDVWGQAKIVTPNTVPKYFGRFRDELMLKVTEFKYVPKSDAVERAFSVMQPSVRFTLDEVLELPDCVERSIDVLLGPTQMKVYKDLAKHCHSMVLNNEITAANAGAVMNKLLQVSLGWVYTSQGTTVSLDNSARVDAIVDCILGSNRKCLVFAPFKHALEGIHQALDKEGIEHAVVSGDTAAGARNDIFNLFQNTSKYRVLAAHPACLAHGVTLTAADTIIWAGPITSFEVYDQANARIRRIGQKFKQQIIRLQSTPVETKVYGLLDRNEMTQSALLKLFEEADRDNF